MHDTANFIQAHIPTMGRSGSDCQTRWPTASPDDGRSGAGRRGSPMPSTPRRISKAHRSRIEILGSDAVPAGGPHDGEGRARTGASGSRDMSVVVERGLARCPRCVAVADYTFVESGPNSVRYEVRCGKCGEAYCEVNTPVAPDFTAAVLALAARPAAGAARVVGARRRRALAYLAHVRDGARRLRRRTAEPPNYVSHP